MSAFGTALTAFGVSVWIFLETGSVTQLAVVALAATLPRSLLAPFAGAYVDRWDRRIAMLVSDGGAGVTTLILVVLFVTDSVSIVNLTVVVALSSAFTAFQWPAYQAATTMLVPAAQYSRAQGLIQLSDAGSNLLPPAIAGVLLAWGGISAVLAIDFLTFGIAAGTLLVVRFPAATVSDVGKKARGRTVLGDAAFGFKYIRHRPGWMGLLGMQFALNVATGFIGLLLTGYILTVADERVLGVIVSLWAAGLVAGAVVMTVWKGAGRRRVSLIVGLVATIGLLFMILGLVGPLAAATAVLFLVGIPLAMQNATYRALWQAKVEPDVQGRVFAARMMIVLFALPVSYILIGPLMDHVFIPLLTADTGIGTRLQLWFGTGEAAAFRAFLASAGILAMLGAGAGWLLPGLRHLERDIPDFFAQSK
ncbi:MAG: MFS transporter [Actinomycetia bacterium]|nr:MFS transporter [Actinomycetes bacterium]